MGCKARNRLASFTVLPALVLAASFGASTLCAQSPASSEAQARIAPCFDRDKASRHLWDNPEWDQEPATYMEDDLYEIRAFDREELRRMVPSEPMSEASLYGEPYVGEVVENMLAMLRLTMDVARETPRERWTIGQQVRFADFENILARYEAHRAKLASGDSVALPRWYHAAHAQAFEKVLRSGKGDYSTELYPGSFLGSVPESVYGKYYVVLGPEVARQNLGLNTCGTRLDLTQTHQNWESFLYLGYDGSFVVKQPVYFGAVPDEQAKNDITKTSSAVEATRAAVSGVLAEADLSPEVRALWQGLPVVSYQELQIEHHLLELSRTCTPQRASELWLAAFTLSDYELSRIDCAVDSRQAETALKTAEPGRVIAEYGEFRDSGLFIVIDDPAECGTAIRAPAPDTKDCRFTPASSPTAVTRLSCAYPLLDRVPTQYPLQSDWLSPNENDHARAGVTNLFIEVQDRKRLFQTLADGRYELRPPPPAQPCAVKRPGESPLSR